MDVLTIIKSMLIFVSKSDINTNNLEGECGIRSTCYPPSEMYPHGNRIEYKFPIKPTDVKFYNKQS